jgi:hypothetical protein
VNADQIHALSMSVIDRLPDDPRDALTVITIIAAHVAVSTKCDDASAIEAYRRALKQMRGGREGKAFNS